MPVPDIPPDAAGQLLNGARLGQLANRTPRWGASFLERAESTGEVDVLKFGKERCTTLASWLKYIERLINDAAERHDAMMRGDDPVVPDQVRDRRRRRCNENGEARAER